MYFGVTRVAALCSLFRLLAYSSKRCMRERLPLVLWRRSNLLDVMRLEQGTTAILAKVKAARICAFLREGSLSVVYDLQDCASGRTIGPAWLRVFIDLLIASQLGTFWVPNKITHTGPETAEKLFTFVVIYSLPIMTWHSFPGSQEMKLFSCQLFREQVKGAYPVRVRFSCRSPYAWWWLTLSNGVIHYVLRAIIAEIHGCSTAMPRPILLKIFLFESLYNFHTHFFHYLKLPGCSFHIRVLCAKCIGFSHRTSWRYQICFSYTTPYGLRIGILFQTSYASCKLISHAVVPLLLPVSDLLLL